jgi:hypothetical protein
MSKSDMLRDPQTGPSARANDPTKTKSPGIDVTEYKPDSEKKFAKILRESQDADGSGVFSKGNLRGKKM